MNFYCLLSAVFLSSSLALAYPVTKNVPLSPSISAEMAKTNSSARLSVRVQFASNNESASRYCYLAYSPDVLW